MIYVRSKKMVQGISGEVLEEFVTELCELLYFIVDASGHALSEAEKQEFSERIDRLIEVLEEAEERG